MLQMCCIGVVSVKSRTSALRQKRPLAEGGKVILDWFITMASRHRGPPSRTGVRQLPEIFKNTSAARISRTHWKRLQPASLPTRPRRRSATVANRRSQWVPSHRANVAWPWQRHLLGNSGRRKTGGCVAGSAPAAAMSCSELCQKDMPYRAGCGRMPLKLGLICSSGRSVRAKAGAVSPIATTGVMAECGRGEILSVRP